MKCFLISIVSLLVLLSCDSKKIDPEVNTVYVNKKLDTHDAQRQSALLLYNSYSQSDKSKRFYEVVYKTIPCFIVNYYPEKQLLSLCTDKGEGWGMQFEEVTEEKLKEMAEANLRFGILYYENPLRLKVKDPTDFREIKTNDDPLKLR